MKVVLDTNVFVSEVFFTGPPYRILQAWRDGRIQLLISAEILEEYQRVGARLASQFPGVELDPIIALFAVHAELIDAPPLPTPVSDDPDDDKFLACAVARKCDLIISGDKHLLKVSGYKGIRVLRPGEFASDYLDGH